MSALKPCPFCGGEGKLVEDVCEYGISYTVDCRSCAAEGPWGHAPTSAEGSWNRRADDLRAQRIRDIVAQQWAVAIVVASEMHVSDPFGLRQTSEYLRGWDAGWDSAVDALAALPSAAEIVGGEP